MACPASRHSRFSSLCASRSILRARSCESGAGLAGSFSFQTALMVRVLSHPLPLRMVFDAVSAFAPTGRLRAAINTGNAVLARKDAFTGAPAGVSVDLAAEFARRLGVPAESLVVDTAATSVADVAANVKQQLEIDAKRLGGLRLLPGRFMVIQQAMGCQRSRGPDAAAELARFVEDVKASGFVAQALARHRIEGAAVAPAA